MQQFCLKKNKVLFKLVYLIYFQCTFVTYSMVKELQSLKLYNIKIPISLISWVPSMWIIFRIRFRYGKLPHFLYIPFCILHVPFQHYVDNTLHKTGWFWFGLIGRLTSHSTIFQLYLWWHIEVQVAWRRRLYSRLPRHRHFVVFFKVPVQQRHRSILSVIPW